MRRFTASGSRPRRSRGRARCRRSGSAGRRACGWWWSCRRRCCPGGRRPRPARTLEGEVVHRHEGAEALARGVWTSITGAARRALGRHVYRPTARSRLASASWSAVAAAVWSSPARSSAVSASSSSEDGMSALAVAVAGDPHVLARRLDGCARPPPRAARAVPEVEHAARSPPGGCGARGPRAGGAAPRPGPGPGRPRPTCGRRRRRSGRRSPRRSRCPSTRRSGGRIRGWAGRSRSPPLRPAWGRRGRLRDPARWPRRPRCARRRAAVSGRRVERLPATSASTSRRGVRGRRSSGSIGSTRVRRGQAEQAQQVGVRDRGRVGRHAGGSARRGRAPPAPRAPRCGRPCPKLAARLLRVLQVRLVGDAAPRRARARSRAR